VPQPKPIAYSLLVKKPGPEPFHVIISNYYIVPGLYKCPNGVSSSLNLYVNVVYQSW